jgi:hypothetical protein
MIYLTVIFSKAWQYSNSWLHDEFMCSFITFCYQKSVCLTAYSVAVHSIQRYRVNNESPPHPFLFSTKMAWYWGYNLRSVDCGCIILYPVWSLKNMCYEYHILGNITYYQRVVIFYLLVSCVLHLCVIAFSCIMRKILFFIGADTQLNTRKNTAKVVLGLTVYRLSYVPHHIWKTYPYFSIYFVASSAKLKDELFGFII